MLKERKRNDGKDPFVACAEGSKAARGVINGGKRNHGRKQKRECNVVKNKQHTNILLLMSLQWYEKGTEETKVKGY